MRNVLERVARGERLVVVQADGEVTPAGAANVLGVSRQFVDRLLADGVLSHRRLPGSRHRRIAVEEVLALKDKREQLRRGALTIPAVLKEWPKVVAGRSRVYVDTNEMFPFKVMDLVLALAEDLLLEFIWADQLLVGARHRA